MNQKPKRRPALTIERSRLIAKWNAMTDREKAAWGYQFSNYEPKHIKETE